MRHLATLSSILLLAGCVADRAAVAPAPANPEAGEVLQAAELARVRCLLVAPFENASDAPLVGEAATNALLAGIDPSRTRVYPIPELRAIFRDTQLELPPGISPSLALELAELVGADAALYGSVDGHTLDGSPELIVTMRLALTGNRHLLFAETAPVRVARGERPETAVRRAALDAARVVLARLGDMGRKRCFDGERTRALRKLALAEPKCAPSSAGDAPGMATPAPVPAVSAEAATPAPRARPDRTPRQSEWARRLAAGARFLVEEVTFGGRTAQLQRDAGLVDLAAALDAQPGTAVRIEAFVDRTSDRGGDAKLSTAMARTAIERLAALGVRRDRLSWAGRGGDSPVLPNFTARGRAANRRLEVVVLR